MKDGLVNHIPGKHLANISSFFDWHLVRQKVFLNKLKIVKRFNKMYLITENLRYSTLNEIL